MVEGKCLMVRIKLIFKFKIKFHLKIYGCGSMLLYMAKD
jgi:hypothetical protein